MTNILQRCLQLPDFTKYSTFLWGPRRTGKTFFLRHAFPQAPRIDLLLTDVFSEYSIRPSLLRERFKDFKESAPLIIDEIQKCPALLDEVHWLIENTPVRFILTGSSARKLRRLHSNLLAGRAIRRVMRPLSAIEIGLDTFDLQHALLSGLLPSHYLAEEVMRSDMLRSYVFDYLKDEIAGEAGERNLPAFSEFLRIAALSSGELINYTHIGRESGVSTKVARGYFELLEDTFLGFRIRPWSGKSKRRLVETEKFYLFDVGVSNFLARRAPQPGTPEYGRSFEHFILMELLAYQAYRSPDLPVTFWRTAHQQEVDFILGEREVALEVKSSSRVHQGDLKNLTVLGEDAPLRSRLVVCSELQPRKVNDRFGEIEILPWKEFLSRLWEGEIF
jgi:uncharacterized protein